MKDQKTAIVTGAGGYLGLAICKRLIAETPEEVRLTIVVTSRHFRSAIAAVRELQAHVVKNHASRAALVEFDYLLLDQCNMVSVLAAAHEIRKRYTRIDYIFFNASHSQMGGIDYWQAIKDMFTSPLEAFTIGTFKIQGPARKSPDGLGAVFEANVLAPWFLVNRIIDLLKGGRLIWISSSISVPEFFNRNDLGIEHSEQSYEASKYELELLHLASYKRLLKEHNIQSWLLQPGVFKSTTFVPSLNIVFYYGMLFMFYLCRWFGSPYHCIFPELASNAPLFCALRADPATDDMAIKYGSSTDRLGNEKLIKTKLDPNEEDVAAVYEYVESLRREWDDRLKDQIVERVNY